MRFAQWGASLLLGGLVVALNAAQAQSEFEIGAEYSEGDYGTGETSRAWYLPFTWRYRSGDLTTALTVPYLSVEGSTEVTFDGRNLSGYGMGPGSGSGSGSSSGSTSGSTTHSDAGMGDVIASASYRLLDETESRPWIAATAKVKFGTADADKGLGTGEDDYTLQLELAKGFLSGYAGYRWQGDTDIVDYNDVAFVGVGVDFPLSERHGLALEYYTEEASVSGTDDVATAGITLAGEWGRRMGYSLYYVAGLSDTAADSVIGFTVSTVLR